MVYGPVLAFYSGLFSNVCASPLELPSVMSDSPQQPTNETPEDLALGESPVEAESPPQLVQPLGVGAQPVGSRRGGRGFGTLFPQLFLIPLLMITVIVLIWLFFVASAEDRRTITQILADMEVGGGHSRKQDAQALSIKVLEKQTEALKKGQAYRLTTDETQQLLRLFEQSEEDDELRVFFVLALARAGDYMHSWPVLEKLLATEGTASAVRHAAIQGLGISRPELVTSEEGISRGEAELRRTKVVVALVQQLRKAVAAEDWEIRLTAVGAIANVLTHNEPIPAERREKDSSVQLAIRAIRPLVADSRKEVSWNSAIILGKNFGDDAGETVLRNLVSWEFLDAQRGDHNRELLLEQKEAAMGLALEALYTLHGDKIRDLLEEKREDRSLSVRNVALTCLDKLEQAS